MTKIGKWIIAFILVFSLFQAVPQAHANSNAVIVDTKSLHIRTGPGLTYPIAGSLKKGEKVDVHSTSGEWLEIKFDNSTGWIASWLTVSANQSSKTNKTIVSRVDALNIRTGPSINSAVLGKMAAGEEAIMSTKDGEWAFVSANEIEGWVHTDYITEVTKKSVAVAQTKTAIPNAFTVTVDGLNVRKQPDQSSKRVGLIHGGETYNVKKVDGNWVRIAMTDKKEGWVYAFHGSFTSKSQETKGKNTKDVVTILTDGTNIRQSATTSSQIVKRADAGEKYSVNQKEGNWFQISLSSGEIAYVADWVVSTYGESNVSAVASKKKSARVPGTLKGLTIVVDPGHGGNDRGTTGARGTDEKDITIMTSELLASKLKAAGAEVILTRNSDTYVALRKRVAIAHQYDADAFVSIHYDANPDSSINGFTTYYSHSSQAKLASTVNAGLSSSLNLYNRGSQPADYLVLRENRQNAVLIELGFLSNPAEERAVTTDMFREQASHGIYKGLLDYFN